jgi:hypothetical protein
MNATRYDNQSSRVSAQDPLVDYNGMLTNPDWTANLDVNYTSKDWTYFYGLNFVGSSESNTYFGLNPATSIYKFDTPNYITHNVSVKYKNPVQKWDLVVGIRNLTDVKPPMISTGGSYNRVGNSLLYSGYDFIGRTMFMNLNKSF